MSSTVEACAPSEEFYSQLQDTLSFVPAQDMVIILGDFNARVSSNVGVWKSITGLHGLGECNESRQRLLDFRSCNHLLVTNT